MRFEDGTVMRLYRQTVEDFGLCPGLEMTGSQYDQLCRAAGSMSAKMRAVRIVAASSVSQRELEQRLLQKGEDKQDARNAVAWMTDLNLLDDAQTARQVVSKCIAKGYGIARAKQALYEKRLPKELWEDALADYPDQEEYIMRFLSERVRSGSDLREVKKAVDALIRRGHSYGTIRRVLSQLSLETDEFPED